MGAHAHTCPCAQARLIRVSQESTALQVMQLKLQTLAGQRKWFYAQVCYKLMVSYLGIPILRIAHHLGSSHERYHHPLARTQWRQLQLSHAMSSVQGKDLAIAKALTSADVWGLLTHSLRGT